MKKYLSLIGITALILIIAWLWYQALFAYLAEHTYYFWMLSSGQNWWIFISALLCAIAFPILYLLICSKVKIKNLLISFVLWAWIFWLLHSCIKLGSSGLSASSWIWHSAYPLAGNDSRRWGKAWGVPPRSGGKDCPRTLWTRKINRISPRICTRLYINKNFPKKSRKKFA